MVEEKINLALLSQTHPVVLYDGVCHLCDKSVQFILKRDAQKKFRFAPLQSHSVQQQIKDLIEPSDSFSTVLLWQNNTLYRLSDASLRVLSQLAFPYSMTRILLFIPKKIRNSIYRWISTNRYRWFGKEKQCILPDPEKNEQFIFLEEVS